MISLSYSFLVFEEIDECIFLSVQPYSKINSPKAMPGSPASLLTCIGAYSVGKYQINQGLPHIIKVRLPVGMEYKIKYVTLYSSLYKQQTFIIFCYLAKYAMTFFCSLLKIRV